MGLHSKINPQVKYSEEMGIELSDRDMDVDPYVVELHGRNYLVALGREKMDHSSEYRVVYFPVYLLSADGRKVRGKIGVMEVSTDGVVAVMREDGQVDPNLIGGKPLLFSFVNERFFERSGAALAEGSHLLESPVADLDKEAEKEAEKVAEKADGKADEKKPETPEDAEEDAVLKIHKKGEEDEVQGTEADKERAREHLKEVRAKESAKNVFVVDGDVVPPAALPEETQAEVDDYKREYAKQETKAKKTATWLELFFKNPHFRVVPNEGGGDCFFAVLRDAFKQIGRTTSVAKLRALLAAEATPEVYQNYRDLYFQFKGTETAAAKDLLKYAENKHALEKQLKGLKGDPTEIKKVHERLIEELRKNKAETERTQDDLRAAKEFMREIAFMEGVDTMDRFRHVVQTASYWADSWAVATLERALSVKVIILSEDAYKNKELDAIMECGEADAKSAPFRPTYYVMATLRRTPVAHYELVSYKNKYLLSFEEIPFSVKVLIVNKCLERNAGPYYDIPEFRQFKKRMGVDADEGMPINMSAKIDVEIEAETTSRPGTTATEILAQGQAFETRALKLDTDTVFVFHAASDATKKPGKGVGEKIPDTKRTSYPQLTTKSNWRRKLDDAWMADTTDTGTGTDAKNGGGVFTTADDGLRWASVVHYVNACKFKKDNPDFYRKFAVGGEFGQDLDLAKQAGASVSKEEQIDEKAADDAELRENAEAKKREKILGGAKKTGYKRPLSIRIDPDYFGGRHLQERAVALRGKFGQNMDFGQLLKETGDAVLAQFRRGEEPFVDFPLMRVRDQLLGAASSSAF
jgi:hypothetical protein